MNMKTKTWMTWIDALGLASFGSYILGSLLLLLKKFVFREDIPSFMMMGYVFIALIFFATLIIPKYILTGEKK